MRVLVTGGSGFIGKALVRRLVGDGWRVRALARAEALAAYPFLAQRPDLRLSLDVLEEDDRQMFRSEDRGSSFKPIAYADGMPHPMRGMVMRLIADPHDDHVLFGALSDGGIIKLDERDETISLVAEKLPPAYDLAVLQ